MIASTGGGPAPESLEALLTDRLSTDPNARRDDMIDLARRSFPLHEVATLTELVDRVLSRAQGLGRIEELFAAPGVTEVMLNGPGPVWVDCDGAIQCTSLTLAEADVAVLIERMLQPLGLRVDPLSPCVDARLADGSRVNVAVPPVAVDGPVVTIRRFAAEQLPLTAFGDAPVVELLSALVANQATMLVVGGTGAGKTTLLNSLGSSLPDQARVITVEDTAELRLPGSHVVRLEARPASREGLGEVTIRDLVRNALRMRPDRLIVGEVRGGEAFDLLLALNTGHAGSLATCHANGPVAGLRRLETLALLGGVELPVEAVRLQMLSAIDVVVHVERRGRERRVVSVVEVDGVGVGGGGVSVTELWPMPVDSPRRAAVRAALGLGVGR